MFYLTYAIGLVMVIFTGYLILKYHFEFKRVKINTRNYLKYSRKINKG